MLTDSKLTTEKQIVPHLENIFRNLGVDVINRKDRLAISCPIHGSDSSESLTIYISGNSRVGNFICWSHHCEETCGDSCIDLLKIIIEQRKNRSYSYKELIQVISELANSDVTLTPIQEVEKNSEEDSVDISRCMTAEEFHDNISFPAKYFIKRGFSKDVLNKFKVGFCDTKGQEMYMRTVVPVFDITEKFILGMVGRSINEQCPLCKKYHYSKGKCPDEKAAGFYHKWKNSRGFYSGGYFYGLWKAFQPITRSRSVILVEGQGDVWRLHEAGIENCLGLFGDKITYPQYSILSCLGVENIIVATDSDVPGAEARYRIKSKLKGFNTFDLFWQDKDCGSIPANIVKRKINKEFPWLVESL